MDEHSSAGHYDDGNRAFLQSILARGILTFKEGRELLAAIFSVQEEKDVTAEEVTRADFDSYISAAAQAISPFDYEIRSTQDQRTKERIYAIVNSVSDPLTQLATTRSTEEMLYVKRLIDAIFETFNKERREIMAISSMEALTTKIRKGGGRQSDGAESTQSADKGLTNDQAEKLLENLVKEKWLDRSRAGYYTLSPRALMELRSWLVDAYNDSDDAEEWQRIKFCEACKEIITVGQRCAKLDCNVRLHNICQEAYFNSRQSRKCPKCDTSWDGKHFVGEKCVTMTDDYLRGKRRSGPSRGRAGQASEEEGEEQGDESEEETARVRSTQRNARAKKKARAAPSEEEEEEEEEQETEAEAEEGKEEPEVEARPNARRSRRRTEPDPTPSGSDEEE